jgi:hypothetical protein
MNNFISNEKLLIVTDLPAKLNILLKLNKCMVFIRKFIFNLFILDGLLTRRLFLDKNKCFVCQKYIFGIALI